MNVRLLNIRAFLSRLNRFHFYFAAVESCIFAQKKRIGTYACRRKKRGIKRGKRGGEGGREIANVRVALWKIENYKWRIPIMRERIAHAASHVIPFSAGSLFRVRIYNRRRVYSCRACIRVRSRITDAPARFAFRVREHRLRRCIRAS